MVAKFFQLIHQIGNQEVREWDQYLDEAYASQYKSAPFLLLLAAVNVKWTIPTYQQDLHFNLYILIWQMSQNGLVAIP